MPKTKRHRLRPRQIIALHSLTERKRGRIRSGFKIYGNIMKIGSEQRKGQFPSASLVAFLWEHQLLAAAIHQIELAGAKSGLEERVKAKQNGNIPNISIPCARKYSQREASGYPFSKQTTKSPTACPRARITLQLQSEWQWNPRSIYIRKVHKFLNPFVFLSQDSRNAAGVLPRFTRQIYFNYRQPEMQAPFGERHKTDRPPTEKDVLSLWRNLNRENINMTRGPWCQQTAKGFCFGPLLMLTDKRMESNDDGSCVIPADANACRTGT